jgi:hypothetical protein
MQTSNFLTACEGAMDFNPKENLNYQNTRTIVGIVYSTVNKSVFIAVPLFELYDYSERYKNETCNTFVFFLH